MALAALVGLAAPCGTSAAPVAAEGGAARDRPALRVSARTAGLLAGTALVLWGAAEIERAADDVTRCRWCEPPALDRWARRELRWRDGGAARDASDVLLVAVPLGSAAAVGWLAARSGDRRDVVEDVLLVAAAVAIADPLTRGVQHAAGRLRPDAWDAGGGGSGRDLRSFFSGHTSRTFAAAAAAAQVARLRARRAWPWVAGLAFAGAAATGWLRVAGDEHWLTDVLAGAAVGSGVGLAVPWLALRRPGGGSGATVLPAPGGIAVVF